MANTNHKPAKGKPISSHPLFPAVVALWFGALFGLGSLAIRPTLIEGLVLKTGIDLIVPAAAPPLGVTARILIALIMASLGAALGTMLSLRINRPKTEVRERKRTAANPGAAAEAEAAMWNKRDVFTDGPVRRPISAHEELGETLDSQNPLVGRRRALAVEHEDRLFQPHENAPLPGGQPQIFDIAATQLVPVAELAPVEVEAQPPLDRPALDLGAFAAPAPAAEPALDWSAPPVVPVAEVVEAASPMVEREVPVVAAAPRIFGLTAEDGHVPTEFVRAAGFRTSVFETDPAEPLFAARTAEHEPSTDVPAVPAALVQSETQTEAPAADPLPSPADLGMTDLARRLQESMARRRAAKAEPALAAAPEPAPEPLMPELPEPPATASAFVMPPPPPSYAELAPSAPAFAPEIPPAPIPMPAALRPVSFDHTEDDEPVDLAALMPRHLAMPVPDPEPVPEAASVLELVTEAEAEIEAVAEELVEDTATDAPEEAFASLLSIEMPRQEFVRIEEPEDQVAAVEPVVIFPGQMAAAPVAPLRPFDGPAAALNGAPVAPAQAVPAVDPAEAERALRLALANLQRISGAA